MLSLISTRLTIIEVQLKMKISTNDSIIIIYIGFLRVRRREAFQLVLFFHSVFYYIIKIRKKVWNETKSSSPFSIKSRQNFFFRIDHSRPSVLPNIIFCFELFQRKIFAIKKKKKNSRPRFFETRHLCSSVLIESWIVNWTLRIIDFSGTSYS